VGVCSECGLEFCWGDLLNPRLNTPRWSFEHATGRYIRAFFSTFVRACAIRPLWGSSWGSLNIANPIERRRLVVFAVLMLALTHITAGGVNAWYASGLHDSVRFNFGSGLTGRWSVRYDADLAMRVFVRPFRFTTFTPSASGTWSGGRVHQTRTPAYLLLMLAPACAFPLAFLVLWQTRGRAQILPEHALRIGVYSLAVLPPMMIAWSFRQSATGAPTRWEGTAYLIMSGWAFIPLAAFAWLALYWLIAIKVYLRLDAWFGAWLATTTVAGVAGAAVLALYIAA